MPGQRIRYPEPLRPGDLIAVTSPSSGISAKHQARLDFCVEHLSALGYHVLIGSCMAGDGPTSASPADRAAELTALLTDPNVRAVVPPWGGELAIDLLSLVDFDAIAAAEPTWLVGYSDLSTLMLPLTLRTGIATLHGGNLMDTPFSVPEPLLGWVDVAAGRDAFTQGPSERYQSGAYPDFGSSPTAQEFNLDTPGTWKILVGSKDFRATGRLIGGCLETISMLPGTPYGDVPAFARDYAPEGLLLYLEVAETDSFTAARMFHHLRLAGWFEAANAVLIGRSGGVASGDFSQTDALADALGNLDIPVLYDLDIGHVPPQLALLNGALATISTNALVQQRI